MSYIKQSVVLFLINGLFFIFAYFLNLNRVWFNIDYLLCFILFAVHYKKLASLLLVLLALSDILLLVRQIFPFFRLDDIFYVLKFIFISSGYYQKLFISGLFFIIFLVIFYNKFILQRKFLIYISFILSLLFLSESIYTQIHPRPREIIDSQLIEFVNLPFFGFKEALVAKQKDLINKPYTTANKELYQNIKNHQIDNNGVLFIVAESLGMPKNHMVLQEILKPLTSQKQNFTYFNIDKSSYYMPTVAGELRELCHASPQNFNLKNLTQGFEDCLPWHFKKLGYETTAMHGALSIMYDRKHWYPRAGFDNLIFYEHQKWQKQCYSFSGACDVELVNIVADTFKKPKKQFFYWLTLNSHAIYDERDIFIDVFDCEKFSIDINSESCRNIKLQAQFFYILSELIQKNQFKGVEVVIVGDHTPPIFKQEEKDRYFDGMNVLIVNFKIKE